MKGRVAFAAAVVAAVLGTSASPAAANESFSCRFVAIAGNFTAPLEVKIDTRTGTYDLNADLTCVKADTDPGEELNSGVYDVSMQSSGRFFSTLCGSLLTFAAGDLSQTWLTSQDPRWQGPVNITYRIDLAGANGFAGGGGSIVILRASNGRYDTALAGGGETVSVLTDDGCLGGGLNQVGFEGAFNFNLTPTLGA